MLTCILNPNSNIPLYEQLYQSIRKEIEENRLSAGEKLPSKRNLSTHLKISQSTVETAYSQLMAEGYIKSIPKSGFYVEKISMKSFPNKKIKNKPYIEDILLKQDYEFNFKTSGVDTDCFPFSTWAKLSREVLSENNDELLHASHPQGLYILRKEITRYLYSFRGIQASPEQIIIGAGSEFLISLIIQLLGRDRIYGVENPGYRKIYKIFKSNDVKTLHIDMDESGIIIDNLLKNNLSTVHITPSHHFPLGTVMPISRRMDLINWLNKNPERYVIEDDYDSEFRFTGKPIPALQSMDTSGQVIYMNTFAKTLAPSLRISYIVLPINLLKIYQQKLDFYSCTVANFEQFTLYKFMHNGHFERHINRMRNIYKTRRDILISSLMNSSLKNYITISEENSGLHFLLNVNNGMSEKELINSALKYNIKVYGLSEYFAHPNKLSKLSGIVIGYSTINTNKINDCIKKLEIAWGIKKNC